MLPIFKKRACGPERSREGFSLIEVIIYVALLLILFVVITATLLAITRTSKELAAWQSLQNEGVSIMDRLAREVRAADSLDAGGVFGSNPGKLVLLTSGLSGGSAGSTAMGVDANDNLYVKVGAAATSTLSNRTEVRSLIFRQISSGSVDAVRVELVLGTKPGLVDKTMNLYNTIIIRSSYGQ